MPTTLVMPGARRCRRSSTALLAGLLGSGPVLGVCLPPVIQAALVQTLTPASSSAHSSSMLGHSGL
jgi:hypothetical protein